ncbi:OLC1v1023016C1 [Oldenlandia corymbosa var. corymbosa]|nr:OLC1v1023016C1 [Oldenlandia corymbosa var. corymbosa]
MAFSPRRRKNNPFLELRIQAVSSTIIILLLLSSSVSLSSSQQEQPPLSIHDLLKTRGLPAGLLPKDVKNYTLSETGLLEVHLEGPCLTKFDTMAFYESVVRGNLSYGGLTGVEGFSQEELFLWLPVKDIIVDDPNSGLILFDIGLAYKQLSFSLFDDPPDCKESSGVSEKVAGKGGGFAAQR